MPLKLFKELNILRPHCTRVLTSELARTLMNETNSDILIFRMSQITTIQIRQRGTVTLPAALREKYGLGDGDPLTLVDLDGAFLYSYVRVKSNVDGQFHSRGPTKITDRRK